MAKSMRPGSAQTGAPAASRGGPAALLALVGGAYRRASGALRRFLERRRYPYLVRRRELVCHYLDGRRVRHITNVALLVQRDHLTHYVDNYHWRAEARRHGMVIRPPTAELLDGERYKAYLGPYGMAVLPDVYGVRFAVPLARGVAEVEVMWELEDEGEAATTYFATTVDVPTQELRIQVVTRQPAFNARVYIYDYVSSADPVEERELPVENGCTITYVTEPRVGRRYVLAWECEPAALEAETLPQEAPTAIPRRAARAAPPVHILHLSDLHLGSESQAEWYRAQLVADLTKELQVGRVDFMAVSGDIANRADPAEYAAARAFLSGVSKDLELPMNRIVVVPGNHDVSWDLSERAYRFVPQQELPAGIPEGHAIPARDGMLLRDEARYRRRFSHFARFYRDLWRRAYPVDYRAQGLLYAFQGDHILFLALNSAWAIDHHFRQRAGINIDALANALGRLRGHDYDGWLKIAVWHHPVAGRELMSDDFLQLLVVHGFQVCLHGHIHEAAQGFYRYDANRGLHIIGAGTFGAWVRELVPAIPWQYNLLVYDPQAHSITVETRKRERPDGAWMADARWGDKRNPRPRYRIRLPNPPLMRQI